MADIKAELKDRLNVDLDEVLKELGLPQAAFERVVKVSVVSTEGTLNAIDVALAKGDMAFIARAAHDLKGVFMNLRFTTLVLPARHMEAFVKAGAAVEDVSGQLKVFREQYAVLKEIFR